MTYFFIRLRSNIPVHWNELVQWKGIPHPDHDAFKGWGDPSSQFHLSLSKGLKITSHTRLKARDHYTSSILLVEKAEPVQVSSTQGCLLCRDGG